MESENNDIYSSTNTYNSSSTINNNTINYPKDTLYNTYFKILIDNKGNFNFNKEVYNDFEMRNHISKKDFSNYIQSISDEAGKMWLSKRITFPIKQDSTVENKVLYFLVMLLIVSFVLISQIKVEVVTSNISEISIKTNQTALYSLGVVLFSVIFIIVLIYTVNAYLSNPSEVRSLTQIIINSITNKVSEINKELSKTNRKIFFVFNEHEKKLFFKILKPMEKQIIDYNYKNTIN